jgi:hypothetical protein
VTAAATPGCPGDARGASVSPGGVAGRGAVRTGVDAGGGASCRVVGGASAAGNAGIVDVVDGAEDPVDTIASGTAGDLSDEVTAR